MHFALTKKQVAQPSEAETQATPSQQVVDPSVGGYITRLPKFTGKVFVISTSEGDVNVVCYPKQVGGLKGRVLDRFGLEVSNLESLSFEPSRETQGLFHFEFLHVQICPADSLWALKRPASGSLAEMVHLGGES